MKTCPHCGQPVPHAPAELVAVIDLTRMPRRERQVADILIEMHPRFASKSLLCGRIFDDEGEDIPWPGETLQSHISKLRSKLIGSGWTIENNRGVGYRFIKAEREALSRQCVRHEVAA